MMFTFTPSLMPRTLILSIGLLFVLSSCLTIKETYSFRANGSGTFTYQVTMSPLGDSFSDIQEEVKGEDWSFRSLIPRLTRIPGISKVTLMEDSKAGSFGVSLKFVDPGSLNRALSVLLLEDSTEVFPYFRQEYGRWMREHKADRLKVSDAFTAKAKDERQVAALMKQLSYEVEMQFHRPIAVAYTQAKGSIQGKKYKTLSLRSSLQELSESENPLSTTILLH